MSAQEFARFLRARRERTAPETVGLTPGPRRRTPGLRRQEVAERAGIGIDWYVRLEQGRAVSPSAATVEAIADALALSEEERRHLHVLARPDRPAPWRREVASPALIRMLDSLPNPAYALGRRWDVIAWNPAARVVLGDLAAMPEARRNVLLLMALDPKARRAYGDAWEDEVRSAAARFRASHDLQPDDPGFRALVDELLARSPIFAEAWRAHRVAPRLDGRKRLLGGSGKLRVYDHAAFLSQEDPDLRLVIYTPVADEAPRPEDEEAPGAPGAS